MRAQRLLQLRPASDSRATDRLQRGRRSKKLDVRRCRHRRHGRLIPRHLCCCRRPVLMFSPRLRMALLLFRIVRLLVFPLVPLVLFLDTGHAVSVFRRWPFQFPLVPAWRAVRLFRPVPPCRQRQCISRQITQRSRRRYLGSSRFTLVVERHESFLPGAYSRIRVVVVFLYMFLEHAVV